MDVSLLIAVLGVVVAVPAAIFTTLQITDRFSLFNLFKASPFRTYRVTNVKNDGQGLWTTQDPLFEGQMIQDAWSFRAQKGWVYVIEGPMLHEPLRSGKYRATYRFKVHDVNVRTADRYLLRMEVWSHVDGRKETKLLAGRTLTTFDFEKAEKYKDFPLDFEVYSTIGERKAEFCTMSWQSGIRVTFHSVRLSQR